MYLYQVSRNARRGVDPITSSPGRDLPPFEDEDDVIGGGGQDADEEEEVQLELAL